MSKAEDAVKAMKDYFFNLPPDPDFRTTQKMIQQYMEDRGEFVSDVSLGQRCAALMKALNYHIDEVVTGVAGFFDGEWRDTKKKVYPIKVLDTAFWFITEGKFQLEASKTIIRRTKAPAPKVEYIAKVCGKCEKPFTTKYSFATICPTCYYAEKEAKTS